MTKISSSFHEICMQPSLLKEDEIVTTYEDLLIEADNNQLIAKEKSLPISKGRIKGNRIAISKNLTEKEKKCVMAEELGHYYTGTGDILDQSSVSNRKQEHYGRVYSYNKLVGLVGIIDAYKHNCKNLSESAEHLDVTEEFLNEAISYYRSKYGTSVTVDNYTIFFEPYIAVLELV